MAKTASSKGKFRTTDATASHERLNVALNASTVRIGPLKTVGQPRLSMLVNNQAGSAAVTATPFALFTGAAPGGLRQLAAPVACAAGVPTFQAYDPVACREFYVDLTSAGIAAVDIDLSCAA